MLDLQSIVFDNVEVAIVVSDHDFNIIYANDRCKKVFRELFETENFVGKNMRECHKPETMEKLETLYREFRNRRRSSDHFTIEIPGGKATIVNVPFYDGDAFGGVVEFVFERSLA
jgi:PAS domain S-box-containing protein